MSQEVCGKLHLVSLPRSHQFRECHDPCVVNQNVKGTLHEPTNSLTEARSAKSRWATATFGLLVVSLIFSATILPASTFLTAKVTSAPVRANVLAVSIPIPDDPPVTMTRVSERSIPFTTSSAVE